MQNVSAASVYLGVDAHSEHCTFCAIDKRGKTVMLQNVSTDARSLRAAARKLPERTWALVEASSVSIFVRDALAAVLDRVIICETRENRLISKYPGRDGPFGPPPGQIPAGAFNAPGSCLR